MDVVFVLDSSDAVGAANWPQTLNFVAQLVGGFNLNQSNQSSTRVGVIAYANQANHVIYLNK